MSSVNIKSLQVQTNMSTLLKKKDYKWVGSVENETLSYDDSSESDSDSEID